MSAGRISPPSTAISARAVIAVIVDARAEAQGRGGPMFNVMLDPLPYEWNGYPIDADFQTGIMISQCMADESLSKNEQFQTAVDLLFPQDKPPYNEAAEAITWFMNEYNHDNKTPKKDTGESVFDFDIDQWRIYAAFWSQYHINLNTANLHWFVFMGMLSNLSECALTNVMNIRQKKIEPKMSRKEKEAIKAAKVQFAIKPPKEKGLSVREQQAVDEFMKYANISK